VPRPTVTDSYLPPQHLGAVEAMLIQEGGDLLAPLYTADEVQAEFPLQLIASPVDHCIRNLTHAFPDGPTYFVVSHSGAVNAMIARFTTFQCIVVAQGVHVRSSLMLFGLLPSTSLRAYIASGIEPDEPVAEPTRSREAAIAGLFDSTLAVSPEVLSLTASVNYLLLYFLTAHEIGHLALGHLERRKGGAMDEVGLSDGPKAESRAQEWDADGFALTGTLYLTGSPFREQPVWCDLLPDLPAGLRVVTVVAYLLFTLMDSSGPQDRATEDRTHPRPLVRVGLATMTLAAVMHHFGAVGGQDVLDVTRASIRAIEIALHEQMGGVMEADLATKLSAELDEEAERLVQVLGGELWDALDRSRLTSLFWTKALQARPAL